MPIQLYPQQTWIYLELQNQIIFEVELPDSAEEICEAYLHLKNEVTCDVIEGVQRLAKRKKSFAVDVRFKQLGQMGLKIVGQLRYRDQNGIKSTPKEVNGTLEVEILSPFDRKGNLRPTYILKRDIGLNSWKSETETSPIFWIYGLPMVGKTTLVRSWAEDVKGLYLDASKRDIATDSWYSWASDKIKRDTKSYQSSKSDSSWKDTSLVNDAALFWRDLKRWCREKGGTAILILDQVEAAFREDGPSFVQFLVDILKIRQDLPEEDLRLVVVDTYSTLRKIILKKVRQPESLLLQREVVPFSSEELKAYIKEVPVPKELLLGIISRHVNEELVSCLWNLTGGHPAFINAYLRAQGFYKLYSFQGDKDGLREEIFSVIKEVNDDDRDYLERVSDKFWGKCLRYDVLKGQVERIVEIAKKCLGRCLNDPSSYSLQCRYSSLGDYCAKEAVKSYSKNGCSLFLNPWIVRSASRRN